MAGDRLVFNGIDATSGQYLYPQTTFGELEGSLLLARVAQDRHFDELRERTARDDPAYGVAYPASADKLHEAGWAIVTAADADPQAAAALAPLVALRRDEAGRAFKAFTGEAGVRPGEAKDEWLARHGMGPGEAEPDKVPYYLLLVGGPDEIPFRFQYELDVHYAVGRAAFDTPGDYDRYARAVVAAESAAQQRRASFTIFAPQNADDVATQLSANDLAAPLADEVQAHAMASCDVTRIVGEAATKDQLAGLICGDAAPELLFTASHGIGFPAHDARQLDRQGALLCQEWPGPIAWGDRPLDDRFYFAAADVPGGADRLVRVVFSFACYGAGTPVEDDYGRLRRFRPRKLAPHPFVSRLPQRLLAHPAGRTLAFIGHVDRAWECSFSTADAGAQRGVFVSTLASMLDGRRVGHALEFFNMRYAGMGASLANLFEVYARRSKKPPARELAEKWIATNDARNYTLLGDPAVRLTAPARA